MGEPHSFAGIGGGALLMDDDVDSINLAGHKAFLELFFHGAHPEMGEEVGDPDRNRRVQIIKDVEGGQFDLYFCSTDCLRAFFNRCVDELEQQKPGSK
ncbi:MAG: hypothetical protein O7G88_09765 [bacterium]|nr:hypothetical protein [bacterium]